MICNNVYTMKKGYSMNIKERGDALLTAYVNKDFGTVEKLWCEVMCAASDNIAAQMRFHAYENPSITDTKVSMALVVSEGATRDYEAEARAKIDWDQAKHKLRSLGYDKYFCEASGITYWSQGPNGDRISSSGVYEDLDPRKVLESLKK